MATGSGAGRGGAGGSYRKGAWVPSSRNRSSSLMYEFGALLPYEDRESPVGQLGYAQLRLRDDVNSWRDEPEREDVGEGQPIDMGDDEADDEVGDVLWKSIASTRVEKC